MTTSLTFGNLIKIGSFFNHTPKVLTFFIALLLYPHICAPCVHLRKGVHECCCDGWSNHRKASKDWQLHWGHLESLAIRAFDKILIFGHWLSKMLKLVLAFKDLLLKNAFTISLENNFQILKMFFLKMFSNGFPKKKKKKSALRYFCMCGTFLLS